MRAPFPSAETTRHAVPDTEVHRAAAREKIYAAERKINVARAAVIVFNTVVYFLLDPAITTAWLAWTVIVVANSYWIVVGVLEPYRRIEALLTSYVTSVTDAALITVWLLATGAFVSPFYPVWYVSIVAIAFRYGAKETMVVSGLYSLCYLALVGATGDLVGNGTEMLVRLGYIFLVGSVGALVSGEAYEQTEQKVRMRTLMEKARTAEARFRRLLAAAPDAILITDRRGTVVVANAQADHLFGLPRDQLVGAQLEDLLPGVLGALDPPLEPGDAPGGLPEGPIEGAARRKDGGTVPVETTVAPLTTHEGGFLSFIIRDVTERRAAAEALEERNRELARSNAELQQFAYVASHDLQEPLRMVSSYVQLLQRRYADQLDDDAETFIGYAVEGVDRMRDLIGDLLAFAQVGAVERELEPVDVEQTVEHVLANLATTIETAGATVQIGELPTVVADPSQLEQLFQNLVSNAIKFHEGDEVNVWISARRDENEWIFTVRDDGIGIPPAYQARIFTLFQRLNDRVDYPGTGIGLAICKKIVEQHGGRIWAESPPPESADATGTAFRFTLPVLRNGESDASPLERQASLRGGISPQRGSSA